MSVLLRITNIVVRRSNADILFENEDFQDLYPRLVFSCCSTLDDGFEAVKITSEPRAARGRVFVQPEGTDVETSDCYA